MSYLRSMPKPTRADLLRAHDVHDPVAKIAYVSFPFRSRTLACLVRAIVDSHSKTEMSTLFLEAEVDAWAVEGAPNKETMAQSLLKNLRDDECESSWAGALELARLVLKAGNPDRREVEPLPWWIDLCDAIAADGWEYDTQRDRLLPTVPGIGMADEATWLEEELSRRGWIIAAEHYKQAIECFARRNWAASNSQLRSFFEDLIANAGSQSSGSTPGTVQQSADHLDQDGRLIRHESEFIKKLWNMLHARGPHPGLSDEDESRFRLLALTGYARFLLSRLPRK